MYVEIIPESEATGRLAELYSRFGNPDGTVDNVLRVHSLNPESLEAHCALYVQSMHKPSPLSRIEREVIGVVVSRLNGCTYCLRHHARGLERLLPDSRKPVADLLLRGEPCTLTAREQGLATYAARLTTAPESIDADDVQNLRDAGFTDREIVDAAQCAAYFAYANRIVLGLGADLEGDDALGQWPT